MMTRSAAFGFLVFTCSFIVFYIMALPILAGPDMPWHILAGHTILTELQVPTSNLWSFSAPDSPWYLLSWGWNLLLAGIGMAAGTAGLFLVGVYLMAWIMKSLMCQVSRRGKIASEPLILTALLAGLSLMEFVGLRPQLAGYVFVLLFLAILFRSRTSQGKKILYVLPFLMLLWVNMHGSFLAGFTLLGAYGLEALYKKNKCWFRHLLLVSILCVAVVPLNPYGLNIVDGIMGTLASSGLVQITEWRHFTFGESIGISVWLLVFVIGLRFHDKNVPLADIILSLFWLVAMLWSVRNAAIFVLVSAPYMALNLQSVLKRLDHIRTHRPDPLEFLDKSSNFYKIAALSAVVVIGGTLLLGTLKGERDRIDPETDIGPAIAYLQKELPGKRILNDYDYGGRIIFETDGHYKVFVDSRLGTAYPDELIADYVRFLMQDEGWETLVSKYNLDGIFISNKSRFAQAYLEGKHHDAWQEVYRDKVASIYVKK